MDSSQDSTSGLTKEEQDVVFELWDSFLSSGSEPIQEWFKKEDDFLLKHVKKGCTLLDVGFGSGRHLRELAPIAKMAYGIDKSTDFFEGFIKTPEKYANIRVFHENAQSTHFDDDFFDFVICMDNTFGNFGFERNAIIKEIKRTLKPDGKLLISVYSENALKVRAEEYERLGLKIKSIDEETGYILSESNVVFEQFSKNQLTEIFTSHGLKVSFEDETPISYMCSISKI